MAKPSAAALQKFLAALGNHEPDIFDIIEDATVGLVLREVKTDADLQKEGETAAKIKAYAEQHRNVPWSLTLPSYVGDCVALGACLCILPGAIRLSCPKVTTVKKDAFEDCASLETVHMDAVRRVGWGAFGDCTSLTTVHMRTVTSVFTCAFEGCTSLASVRMDAVATVHMRAFRNCASLSAVHMPVVRTVGAHAFLGCPSLAFVNCPPAIANDARAFPDRAKAIDAWLAAAAAAMVGRVHPNLQRAILEESRPR